MTKEITTYFPHEFAQADAVVASRPRISCGLYTPATAATEATPADHDRIEAAMLVASAARDETGRLIGFKLPPAVAQALVHVLKQEQPLQTALAFVKD